MPIILPKEANYEFNSYHTFVIQTKEREKVKSLLFKNNIETAIHYPIPIHLQPAANNLGYRKGSFKKTERQSEEILTLPIHQYLKLNIEKIVEVLIKQYISKTDDEIQKKRH